MLKIGVNILAKNAIEQDKLIRSRESRNYYQEPYEFSLRPKFEKIIEKYTDDCFDIKANQSYVNDGNVLNSIVFEFYTLKPLPKKKLRKDLREFTENHFKELFK